MKEFEYRIRRAKSIAAEMRVPGDLAISQRALVVAALANGPSLLTGLLQARECEDIIQALRSLGVKIDARTAEDGPPPEVREGKTDLFGMSPLRVFGAGGRFPEPCGPVDCGGSNAALMLLSGAMAGQPFVTQLTGSGGTPLREVAAPLGKMGAGIKATGAEATPPVEVEGNPGLQGTIWEASVSSPLARDALLLAGLFAKGKTSLTDEEAAPDHLERLLRHYQVKTLRKGLTVSIWGGQVAESRDVQIPGDISYAAAFLAAAAAQPGSTLTVRGTGLNPARTSFLRVLVRMGAQVMEEVGDDCGGEPCGNVIIRGAPLRSTVIAEKETSLLHDELPALMVAAALATGGTVIPRTPATEERLTRMAHNLRLMGVEVAPLQEGVEIKGTAGKALQPGLIPSCKDPYIAIACAVAGFFTDGETIVEDMQCVESRWFGFGEDLRRFQSREISEGQLTPMLHAVPGVARKEKEKKKEKEIEKIVPAP